MVTFDTFQAPPGAPERSGSTFTFSRVPAAPLSVSLRDPRVIAFLLVWFGVNILFGVFSLGMPGVEQSIAWQPHIGGFLAGLLAFAAFDPVPAAADPGKGPGPTSASC